MAFKPTIPCLCCISACTLILLILWDTATLPSRVGPTKRVKNVQDYIFKNRNLADDDPVLLTYIRKTHIQSPPNPDGPYKLTKPIPSLHPTARKALLEKLGTLTSGFFIECGAHDGEFRSNTLELEHNYGWNGLLIEASPTFFSTLKSKNRRRSTLLDVCLSSRSEKVELFRNVAGNPGGSRLKWEGNTKFVKNDHVSDGSVECFPLVSVLKAANVRTVDFLSLDVEGNEFKVLSVFPFNEIEIKVIQVEHLNVPEGKEALQELLEANGYEIRLPSPPEGWDFIYVKVK